jgi:hypothetical protein
MRKLAALSLAILGLWPAAASAQGGLVNDCTDNGRIDGNYSAGAYKRALNNIPSDVDEYTDCRDIIRQGLAGGSGSGPGSAGNVAGVGAIPAKQATPGQRRAAARRAKRIAGKGVKIGGQQILPGKLSSQVGAGQDNSMPGAVLAMLIVLAAAGILGTAYLGRDFLSTVTGRIRGISRRT